MLINNQFSWSFPPKNNTFLYRVAPISWKQTHIRMKILRIIVSFLSLCLSLSSECLGSQQHTTLAQLCVSDQSVSGDVDLVSLLYWPLQQLHQYSRVLLKLAACYDVVRRKLFVFSFYSPCLPSFCSLFHFLKMFLFPTIGFFKTYYCHCIFTNTRCSPYCNS